MEKFDGLVGDAYTVFTDTNTDTLCLTPKGDFNKWSMKNQQLFRGDVELDHVENSGTLYLGISKHATCTTVKDCKVTFDYEGELPELSES